MKTAILLPVFVLILITGSAYGQKGPARIFGEPLLTDTLTTLFIPTRYNEEFLAANKIAYWGDYYANFVVYNFKEDIYVKLFEADTYIESFRNLGYGQRTVEKPKNITKNWVLMLVKSIDTNKSGRIDERDPSILYAASSDGKLLRQLTKESENVVSFEVFEGQGFALVKIQRDSNGDKSFKSDEKDYYFMRLDLGDLSLGKGIEIR